MSMVNRWNSCVMRSIERFPRDPATSFAIDRFCKGVLPPGQAFYTLGRSLRIGEAGEISFPKKKLAPRDGGAGLRSHGGNMSILRLPMECGYGP